ncbi:MAG: hypothetical protein HKM94_10735 [Halobacteria archaeon]|nr:hypothetical protein [Halobacteria archaeon]
MNLTWARLSGIGCLILVIATGCSKSPESEPFHKLLGEAGLTYSEPQGFIPLSPVANPLLPYEHAIRSSEGNLEVRYAIRPLGRVKIDYSDPHNSAPEPNHLFNMLFVSLAEQLSRGGDVPRREYTSEQAKELFNADWAAAAVFDASQQLSQEYKQGLLVAIHKNDQADAYMVYLFNTYPEVKQRIHITLPSLKFSH